VCSDSEFLGDVNLRQGGGKGDKGGGVARWREGVGGGRGIVAFYEMVMVFQRQDKSRLAAL
jgi:hypothetical protein